MKPHTYLLANVAYIFIMPITAYCSFYFNPFLMGKLIFPLFRQLSVHASAIAWQLINKSGNYSLTVLLEKHRVLNMKDTGTLISVWTRWKALYGEQY